MNDLPAETHARNYDRISNALCDLRVRAMGGVRAVNTMVLDGQLNKICSLCGTLIEFHSIVNYETYNLKYGTRN